MSENKHQKALRQWIYAGLHIPEVVGLNGDAGYIFNNMIAKYTLAKEHYAISHLALARLIQDGVNLDDVHVRRKFYGKDKPYMYEHSIPAKVTREALLESDKSDQTVRDILNAAGNVNIILRAEDQHLKKQGLNARMPEGWVFFDDPSARYNAAGISISSQSLMVRGAIVR